MVDSDVYEARAAEAAAESLLREFAPARVVGIGAAGACLEWLRKGGVEVLDLSPPAKGRNWPPAPDPRFDLAVAIDAARGIELAEAAGMTASLGELADDIVFSPGASAEDRAGAAAALRTENWVDLFWKTGYELDLLRTAEVRGQWQDAGVPEPVWADLAVFRRSGGPVAELAEALRLVESLPGRLAPAEIQLLFAAARQTPGAAAIVEIGCGAGRATAALALGAASGGGAKVYAIDHHHQPPGVGDPSGGEFADLRSWNTFRANLETLRLSSTVVPVLQDSLVAEAVWDGPPVDLLWLNEASDRDDLAADFAGWRRRLRPGSTVVMRADARTDGGRPLADWAAELGWLRHPVKVASLVYGQATAATTPSPPPARRPPQRQPRVSLMMPTRNEGPRLKKTIDSLLANTFYPNFELLVLDDASDDDSCEFLFEPPYCRDERLRYFRFPEHNAERGQLRIRIEGVKLATGEVLQFLDSHHAFCPYWLSNLYEGLRRRDFAAVVGPAMCGLDENTWQLARVVTYGMTTDATLCGTRNVSRYAVGEGGRVPVLGGCQMMMTRALYESIGGLCPLYRGHGGDDLDICFRAFLLGYECCVEPSACIGHVYKSFFTNQPSWGQVVSNQLMLVYLNLGEEALQRITFPQFSAHAMAEGLRTFDALRPEAARFRQWIAARQRRPAEALEAMLRGLER